MDNDPQNPVSYLQDLSQENAAIKMKVEENEYVNDEGNALNEDQKKSIMTQADKEDKLINEAIQLYNNMTESAKNGPASMQTDSIPPAPAISSAQAPGRAYYDSYISGQSAAQENLNNLREKTRNYRAQKYAYSIPKYTNVDAPKEYFKGNIYFAQKDTKDKFRVLLGTFGRRGRILIFEPIS